MLDLDADRAGVAMRAEVNSFVIPGYADRREPGIEFIHTAGGSTKYPLIETLRITADLMSALPVSRARRC